MIRLYQAPGAWGLPSLSPFCSKLSLYFQLSGLEFELRTADFRKAPKGKVPYIEDEGMILGDSGLSIEHCKQKYGDPLDEGLSPEQHALGHLVRRVCEESLYWVLIWRRWADDSGFAQLRPEFAKSLPPFLRPILLPVIRRKVIKSIQAQGTGRHSPEQIDALGIADLKAITALFRGPFLLGDSPSSYDATLYHWLLSFKLFKPENSVTRFLAEQETLLKYMETVEAGIKDVER